jgi:hypothetical protein
MMSIMWKLGPLVELIGAGFGWADTTSLKAALEQIGSPVPRPCCFDELLLSALRQRLSSGLALLGRNSSLRPKTA